MKITVSVLGDISESDGTTVRAKRIFEVLKRKFDVILIHRGSEGQKLNAVLTVKPAKTKLWNLKLIPVVLGNKFDCIYCCGDFYGFLTYFLFSKLRRYKIIFEAHGILSEESRELGSSRIKIKWSEILERFVISRADYVIALSNGIFEFYGQRCKKIDLIPVFIDDLHINAEVGIEEPQAQRKSKLIGLIGPFDSPINKYTLDFLRINLDKFDERIRFVVIGRCADRIQNQRVAYTGYLNSVQDYVNQLSRLDAVLVPSKTATSGPLNKILEPMCCALPVFTTPKGAVGLDYTEQGKDILIFEEDKLIDKVNELIFDEDLMGRIGKNAYNTVEKFYSKRVNERKLLNIVEEVLHG